MFISTSAKTGFKPDCIIGHKVVDQQTAGTIHSSPLINSDISADKGMKYSAAKPKQFLRV